MKRLLVIVCSLVVLACSTNSAFAVLYGFHNITGNNATNAGIGETQLFMEVTDVGSNQVKFEFTNTGPAASSITDIYFDDGSLLGIASIDNSSTGVSFSQPATPAELPGANNANPDFETTQNFSADSDSPPPVNGVNPGEYVGIIFDLQAGQDFDDVIAQLTSGELRAGIHVQAFALGGSESFVNNNTPVPEPSTLLLLGTSLACLGLWTLRRR